MADTNLAITNCNPRVYTIDSSCGCTLTRASISALRPSDILAFGNTEIDSARIILGRKEARLIGVQENSLMDLLMSRVTPRKGAQGGGSIIAPYELIPQRTVVNVNSFVIDAGVIHPAAGVGSIPFSAWQITVKVHGGSFASPLKSIEAYFLVGRYINVRYTDSGGVVRNAMFKILDSVNANAGGVEKALLTIQPNKTDDNAVGSGGWRDMTNPQKAVYQPTHGVVNLLHNSVSDYEAYCNQQPVENNLGLRAIWRQTMRETQCYSDEYLKALNAPYTNEYFRRFKTMPLAEQKRIQGLRNERDLWNTLIYGDEISEKQTVEGYTNLPQVSDPLNPSCPLEFKSNMLGYRRQLLDCNRVVSLGNVPLNLDNIFQYLYALKRNRETNGSTIDTIDSFTDRFTASNILTAMNSYYKLKYDIITNRNYVANEALSFENVVKFRYTKYQIPEIGLDWAVFQHSYFDDNLAAYPTANDDDRAGRSIMFPDWSDIDVWVYGTASVNRQTNIYDNLYNCVIKPNIQHYLLNSKTMAMFVGDPNRHLWIEGFNELCPIVTYQACLATPAE